MQIEKTKYAHWQKEIFYYTSLAVLFSIPLDYAFSSIAIGIFVGLNLPLGLIAKTRNFKLSYFMLIGLYLLGALSIAWSVFPDLTTKSLSREMALVLIPLTLIVAPKMPKDRFFDLWKMFSIYLVGMFICLIFYALYRWDFFGLTNFFFYHELTIPLRMNAIFMSFLVAICILVLFQRAISGKMFELFFVLILAVFLILLSSKLLILLTLLGVVLQIVLKRISYKYVLLPIAIGALAILFVKPVQERFLYELDANYAEVLENEKFSQIYPWRGSTIRLLQARVGVEILNENDRWTQGIGLGASQPLIKENQKQKDMYHSYGNYNFHSQYMQWLVELGIIGLLMYLGFLGKMFVDFRQNIMVISIIFLIFGFGFTESFLWRQRGLLTFLMTIGTVYQFGIREKNNA